MIYLTESFAWCMVQVTLLAVAAAGIYHFARRVRAGGQAAMLVTCLATVGLLTLLCVSPWPRWRLMATGSTLDEDEVRAVPVDASEFFKGDLETMPRADVFAALPSASPGLSSSPDPAAAPVAAARQIDWALVEENSHASVPWWHYVVWAAWAASAIGIIRLLIGTLYLRRCRREGAPINDDSLRSLFDEIREHYGIDRPVDLRESPRLGVAATVGWRRPIVLLPAGWRVWTAEQRRAVLAHELAHVRERHFPAWLICQLSVVAHFYHPLVHWLARRLRLEQEIAADALAAGAFADRRQYAAVLAGLALGPTRPPFLVAPIGLFMSRPLLMRRIAMLRKSNEPSRSPSAWRRYSLLAVLMLAAVAVAGLRASAQDEPQLPPPPDAAQTTRVVALLRASRQESSLVGPQNPPMSDAAWKAFCSTQLALLKSDWLLQVAIRPPEVLSLPILRSQPHKVVWLQKHLRVGFVGDSEILYVLMYCTPDNADATRKLVDAVVRAYQDEVLYGHKMRKLGAIDATTRSLRKLNDELARKHQLYLDTAEAEGSARALGNLQIEQQIILQRLDRIEVELMRLESEYLELQTSGKEGNVKFYEQRIAQLTERREELLARISKSSVESVELSRMRSELDQLQRIADDMAVKLQTMEVDLSAPEQIVKLHDAMASDVGPPPAGGR